MTTLLLYLITGTILATEISELECARRIGHAEATSLAGGQLHYVESDGLRQTEVLIVRLACGGHDIVLELPPSFGPCDTEV